MNKTHHTYVVAVDMSALSTLALDEALSLAVRDPNAELHVVQVVNPAPNGLELAEAERRLTNHVTERMNRLEGSGERLAKRVVAHLTSGSVANQIVQLATDLHADVILIGTHGRSGIERLIIGSVAELVVRKAPCPVYVLRQKDFTGAVPEIEPPCAACVARRRETGGAELWCETHGARRAPRHTYFTVRPDEGRHAPYSGGIA